MSDYNLALSKIQWITNSQKFNEQQLIEIGDAIAAFHDCIVEIESLKDCVRDLAPLVNLKPYCDCDSDISCNGKCDHYKLKMISLKHSALIEKCRDEK